METTRWFHAQATGELVRKLMYFSHVQIQLHAPVLPSLPRIYHGQGNAKLDTKETFVSLVRRDTHQPQRTNAPYAQKRTSMHYD